MCKRLIYLTCFVLALVFFPPVTHAQVDNLLQNPSFEEDEDILDDPTWEQWCTWNPAEGAGSTATVVDTEFIDGGKSLRVDPKGPENWHFIVVNIGFAADLSKDYTASFWAKAQEPRTITVQMKASDNSVSAWGATDFDLTTEWAEYSYTSNVLHTDVKLEFLLAGSEVPLWMDFVLVYEGEYVAGIEPGAASRVKAAAPEPADGALHPNTWVNLAWRAGGRAVSHDVYVGDNWQDVNSGAEGTFVGNQADTSLIIGFPGFPYPDGLVPGMTYYWRIDEVNDADPNSPWKGDIWSFSIPPKTAYAPVPADGTDSVDLEVTLSWTAGYESRLHTVYIGDDPDTIGSATGGPPTTKASFTPASLEEEKIYYWRVDEFDGVETHKGEVWSFGTPGAVADPQPANGAVDVQTIETLSWTAADNAASHELYFGTDVQAVRDANTASPEYVGPKALGAESYDPGGLTLDSSYAWRVDEVYPGGTVKGLVWTFTTADFISVDDFESYNDLDPPDPAMNRIFDKWIDGFGTTTNGALVGNDLPPYAEQTVVHSGAQSMIYRYDNANKTSEATLTLVYPRDWTIAGVTRLSLWVRGGAANAADRIFVALNGTAVVYHDDPAATQLTGWNEWVIDLSAFGVDLTNVNSITIGVGTQNSPDPAGGSGTLYFDDIRLVR
ncbi:MAG: carbohydrate binding domain-containing protein [Planctomycetota bacterium]